MLHKIILNLRSVASDASTATRQGQRITSNLLIPASTMLSSSHFSSKAASKGPKAPKASGGSKNNKLPKSKSKASTSSSGLLEDNTADDESVRHSDQPDGEQARLLRLAEEMNDKTLDIGPNARPLFSTTPSISQLTRKDTCTYMLFSEENLKATLPEGLPTGMLKEFEESKRPAVLVRQGFLDLRDNFRRIVDPPLRSSDGKDPKVRRQILMNGPVSSGKSIVLSMLVHWAREEGWLVFYVPKGKEWSHGGFFYKNPQTNLWDTPVQAAKILQDFLKYNESRLQQLPCQIFDPIPLGEGAGVGWMRGVDSMSMPEGSTLYDLIQTGIAHTHAAVGVVVRLRKELSLVKDIPVLIAIDQYNSWFTFSEFEEPVTVRSCRPIHAREISTVNAFRSMMHNDMMVGAFSHSTAVGKLRKDLPDVPLGARIDLPRYSLDEAATVCHFYLRQRLIRREAFSEEKWKKMYYLANGNGGEMRSLSPFLR